jgi:hypothetical protein
MNDVKHIESHLFRFGNDKSNILNRIFFKSHTFLLISSCYLSTEYYFSSLALESSLDKVLRI